MSASGWRWLALGLGLALLAAGRGGGLVLVLVWAVWTWLRGVQLPMRRAGCAFGGYFTGHKTSRHIAIHEAGHVAVARAVGLKVTDVSVGKGWGWTGVRKWSKDPVANIAFLLGGRYATNSGSGCGYDDSVIKSMLRKVPPERRDAVYKEAKSKAKAAVGWGSGISGMADTILEKGSL